MTATRKPTSPRVSEEDLNLFLRYISEQGLKLTRQREAILEAFVESDSHIDIEELFQRVRLRAPGVGHATIYRTMKLLLECGIAEERHFGDGVTRYERADQKKHHDHLICVKCGKIVEFTNHAIELLQEKVADHYGFLIHDHKLELYGLCKECREEKKEAAGHPELGDGAHNRHHHLPRARLRA